MTRNIFGTLLVSSIALSCVTLLTPREAAAQAGFVQPASIVHKVRDATERLEMTVNTSRILSLDLQIPRVVVANPDVIAATPLSPTQIQISANKAGVTQVNLWDENNQIHAIDVVVYGDTRELSLLLAAEFPNASLKVRPVADSVLISGFVNEPRHEESIIRIAEEFYPVGSGGKSKVLTNLQIGGVHEVLLHVKIMEVSRTKMRALGMDWHALFSSGSIVSHAAGLVGGVKDGAQLISPDTTLEFVVNGSGTSFFGVLEAMCERDLAKILAEPTLVAVSGRPAYFLAGGQVPIESGGSLGVPPSVSYKDYGTQVDFVPFVLGDGRIRLEVRPRISEIDTSRGVNGNPAFKVREIDTGVVLQAGQTLAIAGLLQTLIEAERRGIPWVSDLPYIGNLFGRIEERKNEVELLVLVTPELISPMDADEVPPYGPGMNTTSPSDWELYMRGYLEVPQGCPCGGVGCYQCIQQTSGYTEPGMILGPEQPGPVLAPEQIQSIPVVPPAVPSLNTGVNRSMPTHSSYGQRSPIRPIHQPVSAARRQVTDDGVAPLSSRRNPNGPGMATATPESIDTTLPGFLGPIGYDLAQ